MTKRKASVALDTGNESSSTQDNNSNSTSATNTTTGTNKNSGLQNGTSAATSDNSCGNQGKNKKERSDNWSSAEIQVLHRGIESRRSIFYGPPSQAMKKNRELAWESITEEVNSVSTTPRTLSQVMKKYKNEKCRAKRKFIGTDKNGHDCISNNNTSNNSSNCNNSNNITTNNTNLSAQSHTTNQQLQLSTPNESMPSQTSSINVVKLAPHNVAKTMIDIQPGHVQQIQMPNDDMVLIVPPEMDGLLSGMNIVSDALNNQQHTHQNQHTLQAINTGGVCSLVYSSDQVCNGDQQQNSSNNVVGVPNQLSSSHLMHHRGPVEQIPQGQQQHQQPQHQQQLHQHQQQTHQHQQQQHQQSQQHQQQPQQHQQSQHHPQLHHLTQHPSQHHLQPSNPNASGVIGGVAIESQLKNLLFNLLLKEGQSTITPDHNKQSNDMLAVIASSLNKIEAHLGRISKVAGSLLAQNVSSNLNEDNPSSSLNTTIMNSSNGGTNENIMTGGCANTISNQGDTEA